MSARFIGGHHGIKLRFALYLAVCLAFVLTSRQVRAEQEAGGKGLADSARRASSVEGSENTIATDSYGRMDTATARQRARRVFDGLVRSLPSMSRAELRGIRLVLVPAAKGMNAVAACTPGGGRIIEAESGLLPALAGLSETAAYDALHPGGFTVRAYSEAVAKAIASGESIPRAKPGRSSLAF